MINGFSSRLRDAVTHAANPVLVGLDPRLDQLPATLRESVDRDSPAQVARAFTEFCCGVIDVVAPLVPAVKPQAAFFEQYGPPGMQALANVIQYAHDHGLIVIVDGKRNDIGSTATAYAQAYLGSGTASVWGGDALTVSPYLGRDSLTPFVDVATERAAGIFVLVKTSNPGGGLLQDLITDGLPVYRHVARLVHQLSEQTRNATGYGAVGAVVGATYPDQLAELRGAMPHAWFLVPGFGAQGGSAADVRGAFDDRGLGAIVNSSRAIIFAHARPEYRETYGEARWQNAVDAATRAMIDQLRTKTTAGRL